MKKLLFISDSYTTGLRLIPVYLQAQKHPDFDPVFYSTNLPNSELSPLLQQHGVQAISHQNVIDAAAAAELNRRLNAYQDAYRQAVGPMPDRAINYRGVPVLGLFKDYLLDWNRSKITFMYFFDRLVERVRPDMLVVAYCCGGSKKYYVNRAKQLGIPSLHLQYGYRSLEIGMVQKRFNADYYCLWGPAQLEPYLFEEQHRRNAFITGNPTFDLYEFDKAEARRILEVPARAKVFAVGIHLFDAQMKRAAEELSRAELTGDEFFVFKYHPIALGRMAEAAAMLDPLGISYKLVGLEHSPYTVLRASDCYVTYDQETLFLESYFFGTTNLLLNKDDGGRHTLLYDFLPGTLLEMEGLHQLSQVPELAAGLDQAGQQNAVEQLWFKTDYKASQRVLEVAAGLLA